jgi:hypothetical protein
MQIRNVDRILTAVYPEMHVMGSNPIIERKPSLFNSLSPGVHAAVHVSITKSTNTEGSQE